MKINAIGKKVYIILNKVGEAKTEGGIILAEKNSQLVRVGVVQSVGEEVEYVKAGDKVLVGFHVGTVLDSPVLFESGVGDTHRILTESEIMAVVTE